MWWPVAWREKRLLSSLCGSRVVWALALALALAREFIRQLRAESVALRLRVLVTSALDIAENDAISETTGWMARDLLMEARSADVEATDWPMVSRWWGRVSSTSAW